MSEEVVMQGVLERTIEVTIVANGLGIEQGQAFPSITVDFGTISGTETDVQVNGTSVTRNGVANILTKTAYDARTNKIATMSDLPKVPTISTNVAKDKEDNNKTTGAKAVYDEIHPAVESLQPARGMLPNVMYNFGTLVDHTQFSMASASNNAIVNHWYWTFDTPSTAPTITWPAAITSWFGGSAPTINAGKHYEISVLNGIGCWMEV